MPRHVAIIMDGNGRWARRRGLPRSAGHRAGLNRIEEIIQAATEHGVAYLTLYAFSTENWRRPQEEVHFLMRLFGEALQEKTRKLHGEGIKIRFIGRRDRLPFDLARKMEEAERTTSGNDRLTLVLAIDYGSRDEILGAVRSLVQKVKDGAAPETVTEGDLQKALYTADLPDPDLIIRPSGEYRLSNFLLWQGAYAEMYFTPTLWPDFGREEFVRALLDYAKRERRFGRA